MELQLEIVSSEMIKPSTPTPKHLNRFMFSRLDQFFQFTYVPHVLFYQPPPSLQNNGCTNNMTIVTRLKQSLSQSLSLYYPFAGRITSDESAIECNDKGVSFVVARALDCTILAFLDAPNRVDLVGRFLSKNIYDDNNNNGVDLVAVSPPLNVTTLVTVAIQVTVFDCGGFVISGQFIHKVCDGATWGNFLKTWASFGTGRVENIVTPDLETVFSLFPPIYENIQPAGRKVRTLVPLDDNEAAQEINGLCIVKAFAFSSQAICALQAKGASDEVQYPTRIEAVSGFISKHVMCAAVADRASSSSSAKLGAFGVTHALNMRPRFDPPLPSSVFGNLLIDTIAHYEGHTMVGETRPNLPDLVFQIRKSLAIAKNVEFVNKFRGKEGGEVLSNYKDQLSKLLGSPNTITCRFTSWGGLNMNPDFGSGAPIWAGFTGGRLNLSFKNLIILMETCNAGIEAWLILDEQEMIILENDQDFFEFASHSAGKSLL